MFLFDKARTSRQKYSTGNCVSVKWKTNLNTFPPFGAESTAVLDNELNVYFGSHSGNFYAIDRNGKIRWVFTTTKKIYSSPLLYKERLYFTGGDGNLYCLDLNGKLIWVYNIGSKLMENKLERILSHIRHLPFTFDFKRKKNITYKSWASPNLFDDYLFVTGYGPGLMCIKWSGELKWELDLGFPRYQLSGVAIDNDNKIYVASRKGILLKVDLSGRIIWKSKINRFWEPWGNPVINNKENIVYSFFSKGEQKGIIVAHTLNGEKLWKIFRNSGIRGSCALSNEGEMYVNDFSGYILKIDAKSGEILLQKKITTAIRGLWTTPTLDSDENILLTIKDGPNSGRIMKLNKELKELWSLKIGKSLSVPVIDKNSCVYVGDWNGNYYCINTLS